MLKESEECKKIVAKHFNKSLKMTNDDELEFQKANVIYVINNLRTKISA